MLPNLRARLGVADGVSLACALVMLVAFAVLPWLALPGEDAADATVTGLQIVRAAGGDSGVPGDVSTLFLVVIPAAAVSAGLLALWPAFGSLPARRAPRLMLYVGVFALLYYYGLFFAQSAGAAGSAGVGFWLAFVAGAGLIVQYWLPRPDVRRAAEEAPEGAAPAGSETGRGRLTGARARLGAWFGRIPAMAFLLGGMGAVALEQLYGRDFARLIGFRSIPKFFGIVDILEPFSSLDFSGILAPFFPTRPVEAPLQQSGEAIGRLISDFVSALFYQNARNPGFFDSLLRVLIYDVIVFVIPVVLAAVLLRPVADAVLSRLPRRLGMLLHVILVYMLVTLWGADGGTRELVLVFMGINVMLTVSLNLVNGYMGEFSVGHAAFMAVGAYVSSIITMWAFVENRVFEGSPHLPPELGLPFGFIVALIAGGAAAALAGLLVAFPSFRTRGDYLAIVTLAVNFIVQGVINNLDAIGGPRGLNGVPLWSNLHWVLITTILAVVIIHNLVNSTFGKGIVAIREDEIAAGLMGVNTRRVKLVAFLVSSFVAGVAGGLFAHQLAYINPGNFGILKSTEALVMVYLGGMGSISGSIIAAVVFTLLIEALRPLAVLKWVVIPLILILLMLFRPMGLFGFREIKFNLGRSREETLAAKAKKPEMEAGDAVVAD